MLNNSKKDNSKLHGLNSIEVNHENVEINLRIGDRFYISSVLEDIFGGESNSITKKYILMPGTPFGGPCDIYEQIRIGSDVDSFYDLDTRCPGGKLGANLPMIGTSNVLKQGYINRACDSLVSEDKFLKFAISKIFKNKLIMSPDKNTLTKAFNLFYPLENPSQELLESLAKLGQRQEDPKFKWAEVLFVLCIDPRWQLI